MRPSRSGAATVVLMTSLWLMPAANAATGRCTSWPAWQAFKSSLMENGRIVDRSSAAAITTSEGQSYGLFFALVANDRDGFDRLLDWTQNNLAQGDLTRHLPAWLWGKGDDGQWSVLDANAASDADLWFAYTLEQAGRLWNDRRLRVLSRAVARRILEQETARIPGLGLILLPAPQGFQPAPDQWRLNPSYVPLQLLRGLARGDAASPWTRMVPAAVRLIRDAAPKGYAPDWVFYESDAGFRADSETQALGSYNAIRVYLWAGMLHAREPQRAALLRALRPMATLTMQRGAPPEQIDTQSGDANGDGFSGFSAALLPFLEALGEREAVQAQAARVQRMPPAEDAYYSRALGLFGTGWREGRFRFGVDGSLKPHWDRACASSSLH